MEMIRKQFKRNRSGSLLPLAIIMVVVLFIVGLALIRLGLSARMHAVRTVSGMSARCAADAGLTKARYRMDKKLADEETWDNSNLPEEAAVQLPNSYSNYSFDVTGDPCSSFIITSTGKRGFAEEVVFGELVVKSLWFGIGIKETLEAKVGAQFSTVSSGAYLSIQTNSTEPGAIGFKSEVVLPGDVIVGPGGDPCDVVRLWPGSEVTGDMYAAEEELYFPPVIPPNLPVMGVGMTVKGDKEEPKETAGPVPGGGYDYVSGEYLKARLMGGQKPTLEIYGDVVLYITGDFIIDQYCTLKITEGASLTLYLDGNMDVKQDSAITNVNEDATSFLIYGTDNCRKIVLHNSGDFYGGIYAPNADITLMNTGDLYGAFVSNSVQMMNGSGVFYYDSALADIGIDHETAYFVMQRWWE